MPNQRKYENYINKFANGFLVIISGFILYLLYAGYPGTNLQDLTLLLLILITSLALLFGNFWPNKRYQIYIISSIFLGMAFVATYAVTLNVIWLVMVLLFVPVPAFSVYKLYFS